MLIYQEEDWWYEEWMALHEGSHYDSFQKLCDATDYFLAKVQGQTRGRGDYLSINMYYPIVILQGDLLEARETERSVVCRAADHLQFRRSVARKEKPSSYQIDVIRERYFLRYLEMIGKELETMAGLLHRNYEAVRSAIDVAAVVVGTSQIDWQ